MTHKNSKSIQYRKDNREEERNCEDYGKIRESESNLQGDSKIVCHQKMEVRQIGKDLPVFHFMIQINLERKTKMEGISEV